MLHLCAVSAYHRRWFCAVAGLTRCNRAPCFFAGLNHVSRCGAALVCSLGHSGIRAASGHVGPFGHSGTVAICNGGQWATADRWSARPAWLHNDKRATVVSGPGPGPESGYLGMGAAMRRAIAVVVSVATLVADTPAVPPRGISCITWLDHTGPLGHVPFRPGSSSPPGVRQLGWRSYLCLGAITAWRPEPGAPRPISERKGSSAGGPAECRWLEPSHGSAQVSGRVRYTYTIRTRCSETSTFFWPTRRGSCGEWRLC